MRLSLVLVLSSLTAVSGTVDERSILLEFFEATGGHAWNENYGWAEKLNDVCDWHGVVCNDKDLDAAARRTEETSTEGVVLGLKLSENFLTGRTPSSLWGLPSLVSVDFSHNPHLDVNFVGMKAHVSAQLKQLKLQETSTTSITGLPEVSESLESLNLSQNSFGSQIPADLYSLTRLTSLFLADCGLQGAIPDNIHKLSMLRELNLFRNGLTGVLPEGMGRLIHLRHLTLSFNQFHGPLPDFVNDYLLLEEFWAAENDLTGSVPSFHKSPDITRLYLNGNSLGGTLPENFLAATLEGDQDEIHVNLAHNELGGVLPESLDRLEDKSITWVLGDNEWTGISDALCDNWNWNKGAVDEYECDGLMCPIGTFNQHGFQTPDAPCQPCSSSTYFGATNCYDKDDRSVLVELYVALEGEKWDRNDNWLSEGDVCTWYGIVCWEIGDLKQGRVRKIHLPNNGLKGALPDTIYSLHHLTTIDVSRNEVVVPFTNIHQSEHMNEINVARTKTIDFDGIEKANPFFIELYADQNPIGGPIPSEILALSTLEVLSLQECDISGELPDILFNMTSLKDLYLSENNLGGNLPDRWDALPMLRTLALARNQFRGPLPPSIGASTSLQAVSLKDQVTKGGGLTGQVPSYSTSNTLRTLLLSQNKLDGDLPEELLLGADATKPVTVDVSSNFITGTVHGTYDRFEKLNLYLEGNFITAIDDHLCHQSDWMSGAVAAYGCDAILCPAGTEGGRRKFADSECQVCSDDKDKENTKNDPNYFGQSRCSRDTSSELSERDILELLHERCGGVGWHAQKNWLSDSSICEWYGIDCDENDSVTSIQLGGNQLVGSFPTEIYLLPNLNHLKLFSNTLYFDFTGIENALSLETLSLDNTGLETLAGVGKARNLVELSVANNKLRGSVPDEVGRLVNLQTFDLSHNKFSGALPASIRSMVSITTLTASHNKLSGPVYDFAALEDLVYLDLSHNGFTGSVPKTLFAKSAEDQRIVADLSSNMIEGTLPRELSRLTSLSLQVQGNRIEGIAPELCKVEGWNNFDVQQFGCDGILCPARTYNNLGRQTIEGAPCTACKKAKFMGSTSCGNLSSSKARSSGSARPTSLAIFSGVLSFIVVSSYCFW